MLIFDVYKVKKKFPRKHRKTFFFYARKSNFNNCGLWILRSCFFSTETMNSCPKKHGEAGKQTFNLLDLLVATGKLVKTFEEFCEIKDYNQKVLFSENLLKEHNLIPNYEERKQRKDAANSNMYRNEGNECYMQNRFMEALELYNKRFFFN